MNKHHSVIIVGAGLSGLYLAWRLHQRVVDVVVLEARDRVGGRILSNCIDDNIENSFDMGPAWVWPQYQQRLKRLTEELGIKRFKQFTDGEMLYEADLHNIQRYGGSSSHAESYRIEGGCRALTDALQSQIPDACIQLDTRVDFIDGSTLSLQALTNEKLCLYTAEKIILAMPPRLIQQSIAITPQLPQEISDLWESIPTWMAGHCKIVFIYAKPFWREQGLSGEAFSRYGPLTEIYDASPASESYFALTSFVGINALQRRKISAEQLIKLSLDQLQRLFGVKSLNTIDIQLQDWSKELFTSSEMDISKGASHPHYPGRQRGLFTITG